MAEWKRKGKTIYRDNPGSMKGWTTVAAVASEAQAEEIVKGQKALAMLRSLVADIDAMLKPLGLEEYADPEIKNEYFFGEFVDYFDELDQTMVRDNFGVRVYWPNLAILLREAKRVAGE